MKGIRVRFPEQAFGYLLRFSVLISVILALMFYGGLYQGGTVIILLSKSLLFASAVLIFYEYFGNGKIFTQKFGKLVFPALITIAVILRFLMLVSSPAPVIDVFVLLKEGPLALWRGHSNPYTIEYSRVYENIKPDSFGYFPGVIYLALLPDLFFGEPRIVLVVMELLFVYMLFKVARSKVVARLLGLLGALPPLHTFYFGAVMGGYSFCSSIGDLYCSVTH